MNVGLIQVETVTDKGWLLTSNKTTGKSKAFEEKKDLLEEDIEKRESTDSGVSVGQQHSIKNRGTDGLTGQEDSGCGSLTGTEDSLSSGRRSLEELPFLDGEINSSNESERKEDSGLGMGNQDASDNLKGTDGDLLSDIVVVGDGYRSQSPSADAESKATIQCEVDANMASPSSGYRSGHVTCLCSDVETCMWCITRKLLTDSDSLSHEQSSCTFTTDNDNDRPNYLKRSPLQSVNVSRLEDSSFQSDENCGESSLFITCPPLLQEPCQLYTLPFKLGDIELTITWDVWFFFMIVKALNKAYLLLLMLYVQSAFISRLEQQQRDAKYGWYWTVRSGAAPCNFPHPSGHNFAHMLTIEDTLKLLLGWPRVRYYQNMMTMTTSLISCVWRIFAAMLHKNHFWFPK